MEPIDFASGSQTLRPLPRPLQRGLLAIFLLASLSFLFALVLFLYLTYKLLVWHFTVKHRQEKEFERQHSDYCEEEQIDQPQDKSDGDSSRHAKDFTLGIDGVFTEDPNAKAKQDVVVTETGLGGHKCAAKSINSSPNQFLILIYNLLLADLHQSLAFMFNGRWVHVNGIIVDTPVCFTQGLFVSTGDLSSSMFLLLIAIHTYLSVVRGYQPPQRLLYSVIGFVWFFVYTISVLPIAITRNGAGVGGFFVRAVSWCWMNGAYENVRLLTHYLWIFIALAMTSGLYIAIWLHLRRQARQAAKHENPDPGSAADHNPAFLVYPIIYVSCTLPLATGRLLTMVGVRVPIEFFCFAGAMISFNGFFDCLLFGTTRHSIIFGSKYSVDDADTGVKTIAFLQTPQTRVYGNMVWIQGGKRRVTNDAVTGAGGWWSLQRLRRCREEGKMHIRGASQETLHGIQMDLVTTVVVEEDKEHGLQRPMKAASTNTSGSSIAPNDAEPLPLP